MDRRCYLVILAVLVLFAAAILLQLPRESSAPAECSGKPEKTIMLPEPDYNGSQLEDAIAERRSVREYSDKEISLQELSMLLWAGNGITSEDGLRTAPSAGGLYPIELYIVPKRMENANCGLYRYDPESHKLVLAKEGNFTESIYDESYGQEHVRDAAVLILIVATPERTTAKYGEVGNDYVLMEAGHIAQNMLLEAVSLGLGAVPIGGFGRKGVDAALGVDGVTYMVAAGAMD